MLRNLRAAMGEYESMAKLARSLLEAGKSNEEVLRACYGVPFPAEIFVLAEMYLDDVEPSLSFYNRPWNLIDPLERGGPRPDANVWDEVQQRITALDDRYIALVELYDSGRHGGQALCYRRDELAAGRSTIFGLPEHPKAGFVADRLGDSLGIVLRGHQADRVRRAEAEYASPGNRGAGSIDAEEVDYEHRCLVSIDDLIALSAERAAGKLRSRRDLPWHQRSRAKGLIAAAEAGDVPQLRALIEEGAVIDPKGQETALFAAIENSRLEAARFLIDAGANLHHRGLYSSLGPLQRACRSSSPEMIEFVLDRGASLKEWDAISAALGRGQLAPEILALLVRRGIDANAQCTSATILMAVCRHGDLDSARMLLDRGADVAFRHFYGTALTVAEENGHSVLVDLLLERGAKPERAAIAPDKEGDERHAAARDRPREAQRRVEWAEALLRRGMRAAAAREAEVAEKLGASVTALRGSLKLENPPGTWWEFAAFDAPIDDVTSPVEDTYFPSARMTSGPRTLPLAVLLGPPCESCDEKAEVRCSECNGTGVGDDYMTGRTFKCSPRMTCTSCRGLKFVVRSRAYGKGACKHPELKTEQELPRTLSSTMMLELTMKRCAVCGLPALNTEFACGVCGYLVCRCARDRP